MARLLRRNDGCVRTQHVAVQTGVDVTEDRVSPVSVECCQPCLQDELEVDDSVCSEFCRIRVARANALTD